MMDAARQIHRSGARNVLVKGGHTEGEALDLLFDGRSFTAYEVKRVRTANTHGTGCTYSAAIATFLARGLEVHEAVRRAKEYVTTAIQHALDLGHGHGPTNHHAFLESPVPEVSVYRVA
jgi:hydroxymethylpyrimidine/phosphomethylpyrimidine kinase